MAEGISSSPKCVEAFDNVIDIVWSRNPLHFHNFLHAPRVLKAAVLHGGYDLVHVHTPVAAFLTRFVLRELRKQGVVKVVYTAHGFHFEARRHSPMNSAFLLLEKLGGCWTDYLVVMNAEDEDIVKRHRLVPADRFVHMPGIGVDTHALAPGKVAAEEVQAIRAGMGLMYNDVLLSMLAAFEPRKRHRDALQALARAENHKLHLALAGDGPLAPEMQRLAKELGIADRVHFLGQRRDVHAVIRASAATLLPSGREGLSRAVLESLSLAVPVIGTNVKGISDLLAQGCGLLVNVGDIEALAKAMSWVADHPEKARAMGEVGRQQMVNYDTSRIIELHEQLYAKVMNGVCRA
jgi:glycosyltransferase involved in cell wall biosynthesis